MRMVHILQDLHLLVRSLLVLRLEMCEYDLFKDIGELVLQGYHAVHDTVGAAAKLRNYPKVAHLVSDTLRVDFSWAFGLWGCHPCDILGKSEPRGRALMLHGTFPDAKACPYRSKNSLSRGWHDLRS